MKIGKIVVTENRISVQTIKHITAGTVGAALDMDFDRSWDGLSKTLVWRGSGVTVDDTECTGIVPARVLAKPNGNLFVGVYGAAENRAIPTVWADLGRILDGANPSGDTTTDPSLPVWAQILRQIGSLDDLSTEAKDSLVAAINEAARSGGGGSAGDDGATFTPYVSPEGVISWTNDKGLPNPEPVNIMGQRGEPGEQGIQGEQGEKGADGKPGADGAPGYTPVAGVDYYTEADKQEMVTAVIAALPTWTGGSY